MSQCVQTKMVTNYLFISSLTSLIFGHMFFDYMIDMTDFIDFLLLLMLLFLQTFDRTLTSLIFGHMFFDYLIDMTDFIDFLLLLMLLFLQTFDRMWRARKTNWFVKDGPYGIIVKAANLECVGHYNEYCFWDGELFRLGSWGII